MTTPNDCPADGGLPAAPCSAISIQFGSRDELLTALCVKQFGATPVYPKADSNPDASDLEKERDRLLDAIKWALGEHDYDGFRPRYDGDPPYWWCKELRERAFPQNSKHSNTELGE